MKIFVGIVGVSLVILGILVHSLFYDAYGGSWFNGGIK